MTQTIYIQSYDNGLTLVAEQMDWLESAAISLNVECGFSRDPADKLGLANLTCEMVQRGCGSRTSRQFVETLENLGVDHSSSVSAVHTTYSAALVADKLGEVLPIFADLVRRPHLPEEQFEDARQVCIHELRSIEDDFAQRTMQELRRRHYGDPLGRNAQGTQESIQRLTIDDVRTFYEQGYGPQNAILSVAGKFDWQQLEQTVRRLFSDWQPQPLGELVEVPPTRGYTHLAHETNQTHIAIAYPSVSYRDPDYFQARGAIGILSDGVSSRLFTEVREKRGLCYTVSAYCHSFYDRGSVLCYAGTTTERAQETLDVVLAEIRRLSEGVSADEVQRMQARIKSGLIMQQESSGTRSSAIAGDWYYWKRVRLIDELKREIDRLSPESIGEFLARHVPREFTIVTLGAKPLEVPLGISATHTS